MALFESYERRIDKINSVLNSYGTLPSKKQKRLQRMPDWTFMHRLKKSSRSVLKMLVGHIR